MKIGLFTSGYQRNPIEDMFIDAQRFGYDYVELWGGRPHAYPPDLLAGEIKPILDLIDRYSMPVYCYTPEHNAYPYNFMIGSELQRRDAVEYLKLALKAAKQLGAEFTLMSPAHAGYLATKPEMLSRLTLTLKELSSYAESLGQKILLESLTPLESNACTSANDLAEVIESVGNPCLFGMCDIVPPFLQHESILAYFDILGDKMGHMHIIDSNGVDDSHVMPGEGVLPLKELLAELDQRQYGAGATIELVTGYINEPRLYARRAINNLRSLMS